MAVWIGILAEVEGQKSSAVAKDISTGPHTERTLSNTDEAEVAVPASRAVGGITVDPRESHRNKHSHSLLPRGVSDLASR